MPKFLILFFLSLQVFSINFMPQKCTELTFLPMPKNIKCNLKNTEPIYLQNPCNIQYKIAGVQTNNQYRHLIQLIEHQQYKTFSCHLYHITVGSMTSIATKGFKYTVSIKIQDYSLKSAFKTSEQHYRIKISNQNAQIQTETFVGFVRALQTFMQSITCDKYKVSHCHMKYLPIQIDDQPAFTWRAVMIDSARHFLPLHLIFQTIDALMYNKMSVLHWHIVDEDSFPLKLKSHPQIADYASFSPEQTYTTEQVQQIIRYAMVRGVRVIPQLDTPGHAASWGRAPQNKNLSCTFGNVGYMGPLDVTLSATYKLVKEVFTQIFELFPDPVVHLGGDQVVLTCLTNKTEFMRAQNIKQADIQLRYRNIQRKMLKQVNPKKRFMYWMNSGIQLQDDDIVHWWGGGLPNTKHQLVISQYGPFYIDMGFGNYFGVSYGNYVTWLDIHNQNIAKMIQSHENKAKILGAQVTLWSQLSNEYTHHLKIWIRSSSLAQRTWTLQDHPSKPNFFRRITAHQRLMNQRGIPTAPATCQQCQFHPQYC